MFVCYAFYTAQAQPAPVGEPCPVCVSTCPPLVCMPCGWMPCCLSSSPTIKKKIATNLTVQYVFICICCACALILTLDVYLLHLIDLCDSLSKLLCKLPELFSTRGAETHQLLLLWGKRAQHGDAMGVVWWETQTKRQREKGAAFTIHLILKKDAGFEELSKHFSVAVFTSVSTS